MLNSQKGIYAWGQFNRDVKVNYNEKYVFMEGLFGMIYCNLYKVKGYLSLRCGYNTQLELRQREEDVLIEGDVVVEMEISYIRMGWGDGIVYMLRIIGVRWFIFLESGYIFRKGIMR